MSARMAILTALVVVVVGAALAWFTLPAFVDVNHASAVDAVNHAGVPTSVTPGPPGMAPMPLTTVRPTGDFPTGAAVDPGESP